MMMKQENIDFSLNKAINYLPQKNINASKYDYGKVLVVAGSKDIYGAAYMCAKSAFLAGAGMVKVITHENNKYSFEKNLFEAMFYFYESSIDSKKIKASVDWADTIVIGPGLSMDYLSYDLIQNVFDSVEDLKNIIIDADAINHIAKNLTLFNKLQELIKKTDSEICFTPHKKELERLMKVLNHSGDVDVFLASFYKKYHMVMVNKGHFSKIYGNQVYINSSGNDGMATAGSGDVLSGILAGIMKRINASFEEKVAAGVFFHGYSGDYASRKINSISVTAADIMNSIPMVWTDLEMLASTDLP